MAERYGSSVESMKADAAQLAAMASDRERYTQAVRDNTAEIARNTTADRELAATQQSLTANAADLTAAIERQNAALAAQREMMAGTVAETRTAAAAQMEMALAQERSSAATRVSRGLGTYERQATMLMPQELQALQNLQRAGAAYGGGTIGPWVRETTFGGRGQLQLPEHTGTGFIGATAGPPTIAGSATRPGPNPAPYLTEQQEKTERLARVQANLTEQEARARGELASMGTGYRNATIQMAALSDAESRHGALTTEWIGSLMRGETTLGELGNQMLLTIGKFGGWVAAAGLVYGVFKVFEQVKDGARDASDAVANLSRFNISNFSGDKAAASLRGIAAESNTSIKEVGQAAGQFATIFKNQNDVMESARAAVIATKLDNVSLADSYTGLTAAVIGFHEQAQGGAAVNQMLNEMNALQRFGGARIKDVLIGTGRAAGPYELAGGSRQYLEALIATITRTGGQTGTSAATAIARSATRFVRTPQNQAALAGFGIDPNANYDEMIRQAMRVAPGLSGQRKIDLAQAFGGPQLGSRAFAPLFNNVAYFNRQLDIVQHKSSDAATRNELGKMMQGLGQEAHKVGVALQNLGSTLNSIGAGAPLQAMLSVMKALTNSVSFLVNGFHQMPAPLRTTLEILLAMAAAQRIAGRFGIGPSAQGDYRNVMKGLRGGMGEMNREVYAQSRRVAVAERMSTVAGMNVREFDSTPTPAKQRIANMTQQQREELLAAASVRELTAEEEQTVMTMRVRAALVGEEVAAQRTVAAEERKLTFLRSQRGMMNEDLQAGRAAKTPTERRAFVSSYMGEGGARPSELNRPIEGPMLYGPNGQPISTATRRSTEQARNLGNAAAQDAASVEEARAAEQTSAAEMSRYSSSMSRLGASLRTGTIGRFLTPVFGTLGGALGVGAAEAEGSVGGLARVRGVMGRLRSGVGRLASGLAGMIGPLDLIFIGFMAIPPLIDAINGWVRDQQRVTDAMTAAPQSIQQLQNQNRKAQQAAKRGPGIGAIAADLALRLNPLSDISMGIFGTESPLDTELRNQRLAQQRDAYRRYIQTQQAQAGQGQHHGIMIDLTADQLGGQIDQDVQLFRRGQITRAQLNERLATALKEMQATQNLTDAQARDLHQQVSSAQQATHGGPDATGELQNLQQYIAMIPTKDKKGAITDPIQPYIKQYEDMLRAYGPGNATGQYAMKNLSQIGGALFVQSQPTAIGGGGQDPTRFYQFLQQEPQAIKSAVEQHLQLHVALATNARQLSQAYDEASRGYGQGDQWVADTKRLVQAQQATDRGVQGQRVQQLARAQGALARDPMNQQKRQAVTTAQGGVTAANNALDADAQMLQALAQAAGESKLDTKARQIQNLENKVDGLTQHMQAATGAFASMHPSQQGAIDQRTIDDAARAMHLAQKLPAYDPKRQDAIKNYYDALNTQAEDQLQQIHAQGQLAQAQAGSDPVKKAQAAQQEAQRAYNAAAAHRDRLKPGEWEQVQADLLNAQQATADAVHQQATDIIEFNMGMAQARDWADPLAQANDALQAANQELAQARTPTEQRAALLKQAQAQSQIAQQKHQDVLDGIQAQGQIAQAHDYGDPQAQAQDQLRVARQMMAAAVNQKERQQAEVQMAQAEQAAQQANDQLVQSRYTYLESLTNDPLRQDRLKYQAALAAIAHTGGSNRYEAQGRANDALRQWQQDKITTRERNVNFQLQMGQITQQQAIADYQALLHMQGLTKEMRQQIELQIHQWRTADSGSFDLAVGQKVKLPSLYDVRRAITAARQPDSGTLNRFETNLNLTIHNSGDNAYQNTIRALESALNTSIRSHLRAAGIRRRGRR